MNPQSVPPGESGETTLPDVAVADDLLPVLLPFRDYVRSCDQKEGPCSLVDRMAEQARGQLQLTVPDALLRLPVALPVAGEVSQNHHAACLTAGDASQQLRAACPTAGSGADSAEARLRPCLPIPDLLLPGAGSGRRDARAGG